MSIYNSGLSCWQRQKAGLDQDNAGPTEGGDSNLIETLNRVEPLPTNTKIENTKDDPKPEPTNEIEEKPKPSDKDNIVPTDDDAEAEKKSRRGGKKK